MENFQCTSIGIGRSTFVVVDGAEYRKQKDHRQGGRQAGYAEE